MRKSRRELALIPLLALALASCGGGDETVTETVTVPAAEGPSETETQGQPTQPTTPTETGPSTTGGAERGDCGTHGSYRVEIVSGRLSCDEARSAVSGFDLDGPKVQQVGGYTCEGGEAATRPVLFTCVAGDNEVVAKAAGG